MVKAKQCKVITLKEWRSGDTRGDKQEEAASCRALHPEVEASFWCHKGRKLSQWVWRILWHGQRPGIHHKVVLASLQQLGCGNRSHLKAGAAMLVKSLVCTWLSQQKRAPVESTYSFQGGGVAKPAAEPSWLAYAVFWLKACPAQLHRPTYSSRGSLVWTILGWRGKETMVSSNILLMGWC